MNFRLAGLRDTEFFRLRGRGGGAVTGPGRGGADTRGLPIIPCL